MCIPAPAITCVRRHHAQYQKKTNESFWYCAWCLRTHVIAGAGRHFPVLLLPPTRHTRQKILKPEQIWTSIRGWTKSKILVRKTTRGGKNWTDIYFFPSLLTYGTAYESPDVGLSYASKIIAKLVLVAELLTFKCTLKDQRDLRHGPKRARHHALNRQ